MPCPRRRVLELFAGIGGVAAAWPEAEIVSAVDISLAAAAVYQHNFPHPYLIHAIESLPQQILQGLGADFWWLSPPCQPFTRRGHRRDLDDRRSGGLLRIIDAIGACQPHSLGLENVIGFEGSQAQQRLSEQLTRCGYHVLSRTLCPTQMGWPNRRPRFYLLASRAPLLPWQPLPDLAMPLAELIDPCLVPQSAAAQQLMLSEGDTSRYRSALNRIESPLGDAVTACFASSYGKTLLHAGSYLRCGDGYRRFSPNEVARLLGFSERFNLEDLSHRSGWKLLGNSLSLPAVRYLLSHLPVLDGPVADGAKSEATSPRA